MVSSETEHLFICLLAICIFSSGNHLFIASVLISIILLVFFLQLGKIIFCQLCGKYFLLISFASL